MQSFLCLLHQYDHIPVVDSKCAQETMQQSSNTTQRRKVALKPTQSAPVTPNTSIGIATVKRNRWGTSPFDEHWLNLDCCGLLCAVFTWGLHLYGVYAVNFVLLPPWMSETGETGRHLTPWGHFHGFAFTLIAALACLAHFYAMTTDPGAVPPDASPLPDAEEDKNTNESQEEQILISPVQTGRRLCRRCKAFKPMRAHHCR